MTNTHEYDDFVKCYGTKNFKCAASVIYCCLYNSFASEIMLDPLYKANLETLLAEMDQEGIRFDTPTSFYNVVRKIHGVVISTKGYDIRQSLN